MWLQLRSVPVVLGLAPAPSVDDSPMVQTLLQGLQELPGNFAVTLLRRSQLRQGGEVGASASEQLPDIVSLPLQAPAAVVAEILQCVGGPGASSAAAPQAHAGL